MNDNQFPNVNSGSDDTSNSLYSYSYIKKEPDTNTSQAGTYQPGAEANTSQAGTYQPGAEANTSQAGTYQPGAEANTSQAGTYQPGAEANMNQAGTYQQGPNANTNRTANLYETAQIPPTGKKAKKVKKPRKNGFGTKLMKCAAFALVFGLISGTVFYGTGYIFDYATGKPQVTENRNTQLGGAQNAAVATIPTASESTATTVSDVSDIAENVMPSIVSITNMSQQEYGAWFGETVNRDVESRGSGIVIGQTESELYIATNNHVVANSKELTVNFIDDESVVAEVKGTDTDTDLAVISIPISSIKGSTLDQIKVAVLGNSETLKVGESVVAIGNALGYGQSVTTGVLSALNREVTILDPMTGEPTTNELLQTDAAINPGNSGGALLNMKGEVIGINSVKYADTEVEGMGYAIPITAAEPIINELITREKVEESQTAYLGIAGVDVTDEVSQKYNMPIGIYVAQVIEGTAAADAGIKQGDIITSLDGKSVGSMEKLQDLLTYYKAGTTVEVVIQTTQAGQYEEQTISVVLGKKN
ncbi:trypsin-like peptidase domain-containing protein [Lachnospiraceae bacterium ZAX-1]